jgi:hypothetical protein
VYPTYNSEPLDHLEGEPVKNDPYPIFNGVPKLKAFPKKLIFDINQLQPETRYKMIDCIELKCGVKAALQMRVVLDKLFAKKYVLKSHIIAS